MGQLPKFNTENEDPRVLDAEIMDILESIQEFLNIWIGSTNTLKVSKSRKQILKFSFEPKNE